MSRAHLLRSVRAMLAALELDRCELSIVLTGDDQIRALNRAYRRINRPTDVLAFSQREGEGEPGGAASRLLGDVVVSVPTARRQAGESARDVLGEVTWLVAHGLLHLVGWDHDTPSRDRRMRRETERLCAAAVTARPKRSAPARRRRRAR
ncbi:MAG: rRNA maturation RNase YbeY [Polyangiaceae bacterium]